MRNKLRGIAGAPAANPTPPGPRPAPVCVAQVVEVVEEEPAGKPSREIKVCGACERRVAVRAARDALVEQRTHCCCCWLLLLSSPTTCLTPAPGLCICAGGCHRSA